MSGLKKNLIIPLKVGQFRSKQCRNSKELIFQQVTMGVFVFSFLFFLHCALVNNTESEGKPYL